MPERISLTIDGREVEVEQGATLQDAARQLNIDIPTICYHGATTSNGLCRMCVVDVEGQRLLQPACVVKAAADMKVSTRSRARRPGAPNHPRDACVHHGPLASARDP